MVTAKKPLRVVFLHLDLGIGGAEQLVLQLAHASFNAGHDLELVTTRCDANHCFASVAPGGHLHENLRVWGRWIPQDTMGRGRAFCSTVRLLYLAICLAFRKSPDVIVLDVLPTPLPLLQYMTSSSLLFYCHFPDQLLTRRTPRTMFQRWYRNCLDATEAATMGYADISCVNSKFTRDTVDKVWNIPNLPVLYPALDTSSLKNLGLPRTRRIVSLNRYERKKNLDLLIRAAAYAHQQGEELPEIVIAGGYDRRNVENVEYRAELARLADDLSVRITFLQSISDQTRQELLQTALCVVYTPSGEHFGIVPLEAMYSGTPVVAVRDGAGPTESIVDGKTGFLCNATAEGFGKAILEFLRDPKVADRMGKAGKLHVEETFGPARLEKEFLELLDKTIVKGRHRILSPGYQLGRSVVYIFEAAIVLLACWLITWVLRQVGWLDPTDSLILGARKLVDPEL